MLIFKCIIYPLGLVLAALSLCPLVSFAERPLGKTWHEIEEYYFSPLEAQQKAIASNAFRFNWPDRTSISGQTKDGMSDWKSAKSVLVKQGSTPDVFSFLRKSEKLEILDLNIDQPGNKCVLTGVDLLPALRTLSIGVYMRECILLDCSALSRCKRLECVVFSGDFRISEKDVLELAASKTLECLVISESCEFATGAISALKKVSTLKTLKSYYASASVLREVSQITSLENVIFGCQYRDAIDGFMELKKLPKLKFVSMCLNEEEKYKTLQAILPGVKVTLYPNPE